MRPHGKARVDPANPQAFAVCDRCRVLYNHVDLRWQFQYRGGSLQNTRLLVCERCLDRPHEFARPLVLPPDPVPIRDPRPGLVVPSVPPNLYVQTIVYGTPLPTPYVGPPPPQFADDDPPIPAVFP